VTGMFCSASASVCTSRASQCGSALAAFDYKKCQVVTDRCECSKCVAGFHTANCIPCKFF
jgi:hypothetical protein